MNWDALGAIAELLGAIAVFFTLAYLTVQVRQNSKALDLQNKFSAAQIMQARTDTVMQWNSVILGSEQNIAANSLAMNLLRGQELKDAEPSNRAKARLILVMTRALYENVFLQYKEGFLTDNFYEGMEPQIALYAKNWLEHNIAMSSDFREEVTRIYEKNLAV